MIESGYGSGFALEAFGELLIGSLERDNSIQARVAGLVHFAHATRADGREDFVGTELSPMESGICSIQSSLADQRAESLHSYHHGLRVPGELKNSSNALSGVLPTALTDIELSVRR
jgi:hypothetical protein